MLRINFEESKDVKLDKLKQSQSELSNSINRDKIAAKEASDELQSINLAIKDAQDNLDVIKERIISVTNMYSKALSNKDALLAECAIIADNKAKLLQEQSDIQISLNAFLLDINKQKNNAEQAAQKSISVINADIKNASDQKEVLEKKSKELDALIIIQESDINNNKSILDNLVLEIKSKIEDREMLLATIDSINNDKQSLLAQTDSTNAHVAELKKQESEIMLSIYQATSLLSAKQAEVEASARQLSAKQEQMLSLVRREERMNDLIPKIKEIAQKIGFNIEL